MPCTKKVCNLPATGGKFGGNGPGGGTGGLRLTGGGGVRMGGGGGGGGRAGGFGPSTAWGCAGNGNMPGRFTSSTTTGSLPWSKGHMSPLIQNPFSVKGYKYIAALRHLQIKHLLHIKTKHFTSALFTF